MEAVRQRQVAEVLEACADEQDKLQDVKAAHDEEQTPKSAAAKRQAMYDMHMFRRWLRQGGRPDVPEGSVVVGQSGPIEAEGDGGQALPPARPKPRIKRGSR